MSAARVHPIMPTSTHDEVAEQMFVVALKSFIAAEMDPALRRLSQEVAGTLPVAEGESRPSLQQLRRGVSSSPLYRNWISTMRAAQELMWQAAGDCVDRQLDELDHIADAAQSVGTVRTNPDFVVPRYLAATDTHMMPGSYHTDPTPTDVRQGAVFDKAAALYSLGRQGGQMNDMRGHTIVAHVRERFPDLEVRRVLEMGCTVGNSLVAVARNYPAAEVHGIDVGAGLLRYAHARAALLGVPLHFSQQNAEETDFADGSFDLIYSTAVLHETSARAIKRIFSECQRLLRPGGVMVHLEVPFRAEHADNFDMLRADYETRYNNEPFWIGAVSADLAELARTAGFEQAAAGYQDAAAVAPQSGQHFAFGGPNKGVYRSWYVVSGRKAVS